MPPIAFRFRFSLRTLLIVISLVPAVALPLAREKYRRQLATEAARAIRDGGGEVLAACPEEPSSEWLRLLLGDDWNTHVFAVRLEASKLPLVAPRFGDLPALQGLELYGKFTDESMEALRQCGQLRWLKIRHPKNLNDRRFAQLAGFAPLERFSLYDHFDYRSTGTIGAAGLETLASFPELTDLTLHAVDVAELPALGRLPRLQRLDLSHTRLTDQGMRHLVSLREVRSLNLTGTHVSDDGLAHLAEWEQLDEFSPPANLRGFGLAHLRRAENLRSLDLSKSKISDEGLVGVGQLRQLRVLNLQRNPDIFGPGLAHLSELSRLTALNLRLTEVDNDSLSLIAGLDELKWLDLGLTRVGDRGLSQLRSLVRLRTLKLTAWSDDLIREASADERISRNGVQELKFEMPHCQVDFD